MKVCTASQMREIDRSAEELALIPSVILMENAAIACVDEIMKTDNLKSVAIFCGKGNNGGDGFAIARHLYNRGIKTDVYLVCGSDFSGDALINYEIISNMGVNIFEISDTDNLDLKISMADVIVDAIFGTGIRGEIIGVAADVINLINKNAKYILSVDIPSGVDADNGKISTACIKADKTVTFAAYKLGMLLYPGASMTGEIIVKDISIPEYIIDNQNININIIDNKYIDEIRPKRCENSHKGSYGKILIIGGSTGLTGAVCMACEACVRSGAGLVTAAVPESLNNIFETKLTEPMTIPLNDKKGQLDELCIPQILDRLNDFDVCLFGVGVGRSKSIGVILEEILKKSEIPVIIDADGLWAFAQKKDMINECKCSVILTPHEMEMARILGCDISEILENRQSVSYDYATGNGVTLVLKGHHTIVTSPSGEQYININGNSGMATGGSGDVLAGIIAAFCARSKTETDAAIMGVYVHGLSGDLASMDKGEDSMLPTDMILKISDALKLPVEK